MRRAVFLRSLLVGAGIALVLVACTEPQNTIGPVDSGSLDVATTSPEADFDPGAGDAAALVCRLGRRRCVGLELQICEETGWVLLQPCMSDEECDVAIGICRPIEAGSDAGAEAGADAGSEAGSDAQVDASDDASG